MKYIIFPPKSISTIISNTYHSSIEFIYSNLYLILMYKNIIYELGYGTMHSTDRLCAMDHIFILKV
jgi:hypothetical protein